MAEPRRTPGQAEGTEQDADIALDPNQQRRQTRAEQAHQCEIQDQQPTRPPEQAEGSEEQAEGSLHNQKR